MDPKLPHRILVIDPERLLGEGFAFALKYQYNDSVQVVRSTLAGWASLEAEAPDVIFIYLHANGEKATGCWFLRGFRSIASTITVDEGRLKKASQFCQQLRSIPRLSHIPVFVFGARSPGQIYAELQEAGATGYLLIPPSVEQMFAARDAAVRGERYYP